MDINEQTDAFLFELQNVVNRFRAEYDLNHATIIGTLEILKIDYLTEATVSFDCDIDLEEDEEEESTGN